MQIIVICKPTIDSHGNLTFSLPTDESKLWDANRTYMFTLTDRIIYDVFYKKYNSKNEKIVIRIQEEEPIFRATLPTISGGRAIPI